MSVHQKERMNVEIQEEKAFTIDINVCTVLCYFCLKRYHNHAEAFGGLTLGHSFVHCHCIFASVHGSLLGVGVYTNMG
jgi:hypothetical protein